MKPIINPPEPVIKETIEKTKTIIPPIFTFEGLPEFIIIEPTNTKIPEIKDKTPINKSVAINIPKKGSPLSKKGIASNITTIAASNINIPPIRDRTNAVVGFSLLVIIIYLNIYINFY